MISDADHARITAAIHDAEQGTVGEIVCVLARGSSAYVHVAALWAAGVALAAPWPLLLVTQWSAQRVFLCQIGIFVLALLLFSSAPVRARLVPRSVQRARAHREAAEQFLSRGMTRTRARCGVMIFVSIAERYARIIADDGIAAKVHDDEWKGAVDILLGHMRRDEIANGFVATIERCGAILAQKAPPTGERDGLPDRLYVL